MKSDKLASMKILVTGGAGFIGSAFIRYLLRTHDDVAVVSVDALTYAGNLENLLSVQENPRYSFIKADVGDFEAMTKALNGVSVVVHFAAESHNDRGVLDPGVFFRTNVVGTQVLLEACRRANIQRFHHISTCEVFGDLALDEPRAFLETDPFLPRTPYNASKAGQAHAVMAYYHTFGLPVTMSHCCNNYGPYQFPEKLIPLFVTNALEDVPLPIFQSSQHRREWIHADDHSAAVAAILEKGVIGEAYNIGTGVEQSVMDIANIILEQLGKPETLKTIVADRPGHDRRYLLDSTKLRTATGWTPAVDFTSGMAATIEWYRSNDSWWRRVKSGEYRQYYDHYYRDVLGTRGV